MSRLTVIEVSTVTGPWQAKDRNPELPKFEWAACLSSPFVIARLATMFPECRAEWRHDGPERDDQKNKEDTKPDQWTDARHRWLTVCFRGYVYQQDGIQEENSDPATGRPDALSAPDIFAGT